MISLCNLDFTFFLIFNESFQTQTFFYGVLQNPDHIKEMIKIEMPL